MSRSFSSTQAAGLVGVSPRQVNYWATTGLLKPSEESGSGHGRRRRYSFRDLVALMTVAKLRRMQCPLQTIRRVVEELRKRHRTESDTDVLARKLLLTDGKRVYVVEDQGEVMDVLSKQHVFSVPLGLVVRELRERLEALPMAWTEPVKVRGQAYRLRVRHDSEEGGFWVQCVELPGALEQGETAEEAVAAGRQAIESLLTVEERLGLRRRGGRHAGAG